jgi:hypothetical protein
MQETCRRKRKERMETLIMKNKFFVFSHIHIQIPTKEKLYEIKKDIGLFFPSFFVLSGQKETQSLGYLLKSEIHEIGNILCVAWLATVAEDRVEEYKECLSSLGIIINFAVADDRGTLEEIMI